ncbi:MAG: 16S rRNA (cytosine(1402)-N(4))-methyltransferase RsmH [Saprospiraceae bacterium]|nr:16S rRNA (cytosine(1402)-N(4))-methyltransferase RsmH [Pyrinomonadaceae bacterium]
MAEHLHLPVLLNETLQLLEPKSDGIFVDATLGLGGHAEAILNIANNIKVIGIDQDTEAIAHARKRLRKFGDRITIVHSNFIDIKEVLKASGQTQVDGILADLGVSSLQFDSGQRGFSFRFDAPLDMRMDADSGDPTAAQMLAEFSEEEIANIIYQYGEERFSRRIARRIVWKREIGEPITTTAELAEAVEKSVKRNPKDKIHPATRTFQALRIAVNREIEILEQFLIDSVDSLKNEGRLAVITFHSLEDRIVKQTLQKLSGKCFCPPRIPQCMCGAVRRVEILTRKPTVPTESEMRENPRSRSAKLRAIRKLS